MEDDDRGFKGTGALEDLLDCDDDGSSHADTEEGDHQTIAEYVGDLLVLLGESCRVDHGVDDEVLEFYSYLFESPGLYLSEPFTFGESEERTCYHNPGDVEIRIIDQ